MQSATTHIEKPVLPQPDRRRWLLIPLIVVLLAAAYLGYQALQPQAGVVEEATLQRATVRLGNLVLYASGTGSLMPNKEVLLGFGANGPLAELHVQVGERVNAGDLLATQGERESLEAAVAADELALLEAQQALQDLHDNAAAVTAQAQLELAQAQDALQDMQYSWQVQQAGYRASDLTIKAAEAELLLAQQRLDEARNAYNNAPGDADSNAQKALALTRFSQAQTSYDSALRNLNWYTGEPTDTQQAMLDAELALAEAAVQSARAAYARVQDGPDAARLVAAELSVDQADANLAVSQSNLEQSRIYAPFDGTVMALDANPGEEVSGTFITLADMLQPKLEIFLDESDLDKIQVGYAAEVVFDALPDLTFTGSIIQVDPALTRSNAISAVRGVVQLDPDSQENADFLLSGLNAAVDVIGGRAEDVPLVPVEALREIAPGEYAVFVLDENDQPRLRPVEVGIMDFSSAEIISGLEPGEVVSTGIVETGP